ncbi:DNA repair exonuclease [Alkalilimnicola ehrlichii]|uniref:DNA repair exonuclease n=1 Tax=Alkalilimnicola ehrlichii TaxID=351052 RepID=A0A3E0X0K8_9GAMM|nr:DNA repair exonuclease [Alkalilimnicola ehrlichii]RFA31011.1 DNA repair exonuclease [Alkalilimnicola ehrlichii]RFA38964.1 DNA repair exonuclease [Alkalilimnicola ehrlichii]
MSVRILHTADWQLGKAFGDFSEEASVLLRRQRLQTVERLGQLATENRVDAVLVAGDVFETDTVSDDTLGRAVAAMRHFDGPWVLLPGNHDAARSEGVWQRLQRRKLPANIHLALTPEPLLLAAGRLAVLPAPLTRRHEVRDLTEAFDSLATPEGAIRVGLAHGSVENRLPAAAEAYNPISDRRAERAKLEYLALGDWHGTLEIAERTWYSGTPEPDRFHDNDAGNALLVELEAPGRPPQVTRLTTGHYRWHQIRFSLQGDADLDALEPHLARLGEPFAQRVVSLRLQGMLSLTARYRLDSLLSEWAPRFHYLRVDDSELRPEPTAADLAQIDTSGFLGEAIQRLRAIQQDSHHPDHRYADGALQRLYSEYLDTRG